MLRAVVVVMWMVGCSGTTEPKPDAPAVVADAASDGPRVCTGRRYDACNADADNCVEGSCYRFINLGVSICTRTCATKLDMCEGTADGMQVDCANQEPTQPSSGAICTPLREGLANEGCVAP